MATFQLEIVSMDGQKFAGEVEKLKLRTVTGDLMILARHTNYCTAVGMGTAVVTMPDGTQRRAACIGGMLSVMDGACRLLPTTWEWSDEIDKDRAEAAKKRAEEKLASVDISMAEKVRMEAKLYRALVRLQTAEK